MMEINNERLRDLLKSAYGAYGNHVLSRFDTNHVNDVYANIDRLIDESNAYRESHQFRFKKAMERISPHEEDHID